MIKRMRILLTVFFLVVAVGFAYVKITERMDSDTEAPVISAESDEIELSVEAEDADFLQGMTAEDNRDGDVTDSLVVVSRSKFITPGELNVNYAAFDGHNNVGTYTRRVIYTDYRSPQFSLNGPLVYRLSENYPDYLEHVKANDVLDGDLTSVIRMTTSSGADRDDGTILVALKLQVTNTAGDVSTLELDVNLQDDKTYSLEAPGLSKYLVYTEKGHPIDTWRYVDGVLSGQTKRLFEDSLYTSENVTIDDSEVNYHVPGTYRIYYTLHIPPENLAVNEETGEVESDVLGTTTLFVVVKE